MDFLRSNCHVKQLQHQDSSSTQSSGQSYHEVGDGGGSPGGNCISAHSVYNEACGRQAMGNHQLVFSQGTPNLSLPPSQSVVYMPYPYADPYYGCYMPAIGPQYTMHPQTRGTAPARILLPPDLGEDEPIYVNSKQYRGILRRRQSRAKLEAQNKLAKDRKPYLHESRHLHALNRARGCGGRFLNTKKVEQSRTTFTIDGKNVLGSPLGQTGESPSESEVGKSESGNVDSSTTSCSSVTSISNKNDMLRPSDPWYSRYIPHTVGQDAGGSISFSGSQLRVPVIQ